MPTGLGSKLKYYYNTKLISNINKSLDTEVQKIKDEIIDNQILITSVPKILDRKKFEPMTNPNVDQKKLSEKSKLNTNKLDC